jgi:predicted GNAT family acetyltransferase
MSEVIDNPNEQRFELPIDGGDGDIAAAYYRIEDGRFILIHTEVPYQFTGQGIGSQLARGVFDAIRAQGGKVVLRCSFMGGYYARHPEYSDIVIG